MAADQTEARPRYKRSARNYLLDKQFQLKYTGFLVGIALALSAVLGTLLWRASVEVIVQARDTVDQNKETVEQGQATVDQSQATVERGKDNLKLSGELNKLVLTTIETAYGDNQGLLESYKNDTAKNDAKLKADQEQLELDKVRNEDRKKALEAQATRVASDVARLEKNIKRLRLGFGAMLVMLVVALGVAGIVFTHKIAGPIFKMKRLFRQIGDGKLVLRERLRKGDELQHFFEAFEQMVDRLREQQKGEIKEIDLAIEALEKDGLKDAPATQALRALRVDMQNHLEA